jgi:hypothetical protein
VGIERVSVGRPRAARRLAPALLLACALASCGPRDRQAPGALLGRWEGHVAWRDATTPLALVVAPDGDSLAAWFFAPALGVDSLAAGRLSFDSPRVHFSLPDSLGDVAFDGWLRRGLVVGALSAPVLGGETNPGRLPQLSLQRRDVRPHRAPWPESLTVAPAVVPEPERSLGAWLAVRAGR